MFKSKMVESTIDGAYIVIPVDKPLCNKNKKAVNNLVLVSNLFSRYS